MYYISDIEKPSVMYLQRGRKYMGDFWAVDMETGSTVPFKHEYLLKNHEKFLNAELTETYLRLLNYSRTEFEIHNLIKYRGTEFVESFYVPILDIYSFDSDVGVLSRYNNTFTIENYILTGDSCTKIIDDKLYIMMELNDKTVRICYDILDKVKLVKLLMFRRQ